MSPRADARRRAFETFEARAHGHDNNFNLIRMIAATSVLVSHAWLVTRGTGPVPLERLLHGTTLGTLGVYVFFAISGFFITRSFTHRRDPLVFLRARALRLFPGLLTVTSLTVLAGLLLTSAPMAHYLPEGLSYVLRNSTLVSLQLTLPGVFEHLPYDKSINSPLWTLIYEVLCYGAVFLAGLAGILHQRRLSLPLAAAGVAFYALVMAYDLPAQAENLAKLGLPFGIGGMIWLWRDRLPFSWSLAAALAVLALIAWWTPLFVPALGLAIAYGVLCAGYADTPRLRAYNRLGDYSYGMYVYAFPIQQLMVHLFPGAGPLANIGLALPPTLAMAVLSWHLVEQPALKLKSRPARREKAPA